MIKYGDRVAARDSNGAVVGTVFGFSKCRMESCNGARIWIRWPDGEQSRPCSRGVLYDAILGHWILR